MLLVLLHGMAQQGKGAELEQAWCDALEASFAGAALAKPDYRVTLPFYGDVLHDLTEALRGGDTPVIAKGAGGPGEFGPVEEAILREMAANAGIGDDDIRRELGQEVVAKGPANWQWVQAVARGLERRIPAFGTVGLRLVRQADAYLTRPHIRQAVDAAVEPALACSPDIVVAHSLGSIIAYRLLHRLQHRTAVKLFVTLGSPLGLRAVKERISPPPLAIPLAVARWVNGADRRDYVSLHAGLDEATFCGGIENFTNFKNSRSDAHAITDYLSDPRLARLIAATAKGEGIA